MGGVKREDEEAVKCRPLMLRVHVEVLPDSSVATPARAGPG